MKPSHTKKIRHEQWLKQNKKCAILKTDLEWKNATLDHKHKTNQEEIGKKGAGLCRGVLDFRVNAFEGIIARRFIRSGLHKITDLPTCLRNMADYLTNPPMKQKYIHPNEAPKIKKRKLGVRNYKRIRKYYFKIYPNKRVIPDFPKSGNMNPMWEELLDKVNKMHFKGR